MGTRGWLPAGVRIRAASIAMLAALTVAAPVGAQDTSPAVSADQEQTGARALSLISYTLEGLPNGGWRTEVASEILSSMVYSALYRIDDRLQPVPDLLAEPCQPSGDGLILTCTLVETEFHDGTPFTADDVAYAFELDMAICDLPAFGGCEAAADTLDRVEAVDERTVRFHLARPDALFITNSLARTRIMAKKDIEASFARFDPTGSTLDPDEVARIHQALIDDPFEDCGAAVVEPERILLEAGALLWDRVEFVNPASGGLDTCAYGYHLEEQLTALEAYLGASGVDRVSAALVGLLDIGRHPNGTGPWRVIDFRPGDRMSLEAFAEHHHGPPAIEHVEVVLETDPAAAVEPLLAGELDVLPELPPDLYDIVRDSPSHRLAQYPMSGYLYVAYNLRPEGLFSERPLRQAMARCIDKRRTVEAATADLGIAIESDVLPGTWAYQADLRTPTRDVAAGRELLESAGWVEGADGIYERDGRRLAASLYVRGDEPRRIHFADLVAHQVRDCGIEIDVGAAPTGDTEGRLDASAEVGEEAATLTGWTCRRSCERLSSRAANRPSLGRSARGRWRDAARRKDAGRRGHTDPGRDRHRPGSGGGNPATGLGCHGGAPEWGSAGRLLRRVGSALVAVAAGHPRC